MNTITIVHSSISHKKEAGVLAKMLKLLADSQVDLVGFTRKSTSVSYVELTFQVEGLPEAVDAFEKAALS